MKNRLLLVLLALVTLCAFQVLRGQSSFVGDMRRGDVTSDDLVDLTDVIETLIFLFIGGRPLDCLDTADANDDGNVTITDAIYTLTYLFLSGLPPAPPFVERGPDPTPDDLPCPAPPRIEWKPGPDPLQYQLTYRHYRDGQLDRIENRTMRFTFEEDGFVHASGTSFAFWGTRYEFDTARLVRPGDLESIVPGDATWLSVPTSMEALAPGATVEQVYPEVVAPAAVVLQDVGEYEITAVDDRFVEYSVRHRVQVAETPARDALLDFLTPPEESTDESLGGLAGLLSGLPAATCQVVFDRQRGAIVRVECVTVLDAPHADWRVQDLESHPDRVLVSISLD